MRCPWPVRRSLACVPSVTASYPQIFALAAGVTTRYVEERFGAPAFVRKSGVLLGFKLGVTLFEQVYRTKHAWLQVLSDENDAVVRFSVTVTDPRFRFQVAVL